MEALHEGKNETQNIEQNLKRGIKKIQSYKN